MHLLPQSDSNEMDSIIDARDFEPKPRGTKASELMRAKAEGRLGLGHSISNLIPEFKPYKAPPPPLTYAKRTILSGAQIAESATRLSLSPRRPSSAPVTRSGSGAAGEFPSPGTPRAALHSGGTGSAQQQRRPGSAASVRSVGTPPTARPSSAASVRSTQSEGRRVFVGSYSGRPDPDSPRPLRTNSASARRLIRPSPLVVPGGGSAGSGSGGGNGGGGGGTDDFPRGRSKLRERERGAESSEDERSSSGGGKRLIAEDDDNEAGNYHENNAWRRGSDREESRNPLEMSQRSSGDRINSSRPASAARGRNPSAIDLSARASPSRQDSYRRALADDELHSNYGSPRLKVQVW